ncbi:MAG: rod shape-determining protein MreC [Deltaproteobacteria bacterium]|nr:rod shape-determining protein MreC [Deltaproteobacteria bacterium]
MLDFLQKNRRRISVIFLIVFFLILLITQAEKSRSDNWFSAIVQNIAYPFQSAFHFAETHLTSAWLRYIWLIDTQQANKVLLEKVKRLEEIDAESREIRISYQRLFNLLEFKQKDPNEKVFAEVIVEINKPFSKILVINKGADDGIKPNFGVVTPRGIVGKIQSVTSVQSVVQLITDTRIQFPILIQRTRTKAMLHVKDGELIITRIPRRLELYENDRIITSGLAGIFPKGFTVGKIKKIEKKEFGLFQSVILSPAVELNKIEEVAVVLRSVYNIHQPLFTETK